MNKSFFNPTSKKPEVLNLMSTAFPDGWEEGNVSFNDVFSGAHSEAEKALKDQRHTHSTLYPQLNQSN